MSFFPYAVGETLEAEGVLSNDRNDRGGLTKYGITAATFASYRRKFGKMLSYDSVADITRDDAIEIYRSMYWRYDGLVSRMIAVELFDAGVNGGLTAATLIAQRAVNFHPLGVSVTEDGLWGPATQIALNYLSQPRLVPGHNISSRLVLFKAIVYFEARRYVAIVENDPAQIDFFDGWIARAAKRPRD